MNEELSKKEALALAHEPLEILNGGPEFYQNLTDFLRESATSPEAHNVDQSDLQDLQALTISALFGTSVLTGQHDSIVRVLGVIDEFQRAVGDEKHT